MNSRERDLRSKRESDESKISRQWSSHKNPRIVRVSRAFGGKDRHSKVCTVRGLRDRRIRLSVPTAIQLYDLQDRLGLAQPSKVVDWLLDATKLEIDKLPPLPMLPPNLTQESAPNPKTFGLITPAIVQENQEGFGGVFSSQNQLYPLNNQFSFPTMPYNNSYFHNWDPPSLSLSHIGGGYPLPNQTQDQSHTTFLPSASFRPSPTTIPSIIPSMDSDWRQMQNPLLPTTLHFISPPNANSKSLHSHRNYNQRREREERFE